MSSEKILSALAVVMMSLLPLVNCSSPVDNAGAGEIKFVSMPDQAVLFQQGSGPLAKSVAVKISPVKINVMSIVSHYNTDYHAGGLQKASNVNFWDSTRNRNKWDNWVAYYRNDSISEIIYQGTLEQVGDYATGKVAVKKGSSTSVAVGFIMPGDTLFFTTSMYMAGPYWATYMWNDSISKWIYPTYGNGDTLAFQQVPPADAPTGLTADTSAGFISLTWQPASKANGYYIYYTKGNAVDTMGSYSFSAAPAYSTASLYLAPDSVYTFAVRAYNSAGRSPVSGTVTQKVPWPIDTGRTSIPASDTATNVPAGIDTTTRSL